MPTTYALTIAATPPGTREINFFRLTIFATNEQAARDDALLLPNARQFGWRIVCCHETPFPGN
jgi:hypothetical protein